MIIKKGSSLANLFEKILKRKEDYRIVEINFDSTKPLGKGVSFNLVSFYNQNMLVYVKDDLVDFDCGIDEISFISLICSLLHNKDEVSVQLSDDSSKVVVDSEYTFTKYEKSNYEFDIDEYIHIMSWNKNEFSKLENDFYFSSGNYSVNQEYGNLINICVSSNGIVNKYCPSYELMKFSKDFYGKLDENIGTAYQNCKAVVNIKRNAWELLNGKDNVKLYERHDNIIIKSNDVIIKYIAVSFDCDRIDLYLNTKSDNKNFTVKDLKELRDKINIDVQTISDVENVILFVMKTETGSELSMSGFNVNINKTLDADFGIDYRVLDWITKNIPESSKVSFIEDKNLIKIDDGNDTYFCCLCK